MKIKQLKELLDYWDDDTDVEIRIALEGEDTFGTNLEEFFGEYCQITDERSVLFENGRLVIVGDWSPD